MTENIPPAPSQSPTQCNWAEEVFDCDFLNCKQFCILRKNIAFVRDAFKRYCSNERIDNCAPTPFAQSGIYMVETVDGITMYVLDEFRVEPYYYFRKKTREDLQKQLSLLLSKHWQEFERQIDEKCNGNMLFAFMFAQTRKMTVGELAFLTNLQKECQ